MSHVVRLEVLPIQINKETRYGVMEVRRHKKGLGFVVFYGENSQGGNAEDWGGSEDETNNMRLMALAMLEDIASK